MQFNLKNNMNFRNTKPACSSQTVQISNCLLNPNYMC